MPHQLRSPSTSSFQTLLRQVSIKGKTKNQQIQEQHVDSQGLVSILPLNGSSTIQHLHMLPSIPVTLQPDSSVLEWISRVQDTRPEILIASSPKYFSVNEAALRDVEPGSVQLNSSASASLLFLRILNTKIYNWNEKSTYHMSVKVVSNENNNNKAAITSSSCSSSSKTGDLIDWFLIDLNQGVDVDNCSIEISIHQHVPEPKHKSIRKILGFGSTKSQSSSNFELPTGSSSVGPNIRIPLCSVAFSSDDRFPKPWGTYYLCDAQSNNKIIGEITFDISESPECFSIAPVFSKSIKSESNFTGTLTVLRNEGRVAHWQRITGSIANRELMAFDFQKNNGSALWTRSLKQVSGLEFTQKHPMSINNVIEITFASGEKLFAYTDDEKLGLKWADKLSLAIWGQPYVINSEN